jgi:hypothetical protein
VDSEVQWREAQKKQQQASKSQSGVQQASVIRDLGSTPAHKIVNSSGNQVVSSTPTTRKSGYVNSGLETESEMSYHQRRRHRKSHRSESPDKRLPAELKRHLDFQLIDTDGMSEEQLRQIPYKTVETQHNMKSNKVRYNTSVKSNRPAYNNQNNREDNTDNSSPDIKVGVTGCGDSPPPPYSPPTTNMPVPSATVLNTNTTGKPKPPVPQKPTLNSPSISLETSMKSSNAAFLNGGNSSFTSRQNGSNNHHVHPVTQFTIPPPPASKLPNGPHPQVYGNRSGGMARHVQSHNDDLGVHDINHPSPSESPDSQKVDSHHENSDSGLGTDHQEYYKAENFSSLSYGLPKGSTGATGKHFGQNGIGISSNPEWKDMTRLKQGQNEIDRRMYNSNNKYWGNVPQSRGQEEPVNGLPLPPKPQQEKQPRTLHELSTEL